MSVLIKAYHQRLAALEAEAFKDFESDAIYKRIRCDVMDLLADAQKILSKGELAPFKSSVMDVLCRICGTHLDMEVLNAFRPDVLSDGDYDFLIVNSALARWF